MRGRISARQLMMIVAVTRVASILVLIPVVQFGDARQDAWIASILSTLASVAVAAISGALTMKFPGKSLGSYGKEVLGPYAGPVAAGIVALSTYLLALIRTRSVSLVVISKFMPRTPGWAIAVPLLATALYGALLGPDTVGRSAEVLFAYLAAIVVLGSILLYASGVSPVIGLKPVLARGFGPVLAASVSPTFLGAVSGSIALSFGAITARPSGVLKAVTAGILASGVFLVVIVIQVLTTIGPQQAEQGLVPVLSLASNIYLEGLLERTDLLLLSSWVLGVTFDVAVLLTSASILIGDALGKNRRTVALVLFLAGVVPVSHRFTDVFSLRIVRTIPVTGIWTLVVYVGVVGIVLIAALLKERRGARK